MTVSATLLALAKRVFEVSKRIAYSFYLLISTNFYNLCDLISEIMSFISLYHWLEMLLDPIRTSDTLTAYIQESTLSIDQEFALWQSVDNIKDVYLSYSSLQGISSFFITIRLWQYFDFSRDLLTILTAISNAKVDIILFLAMILVILLGFIVSGMFIFGITTSSFANFYTSTLQHFLMVQGVFDTTSMINADSQLAFPYLLIFTVLMSLTLFKMFIVILYAHYVEVLVDQEKQKV
jgi:hypothetical protein